MVDRFFTFQQLCEKLGPEFEKEYNTPALQEFPPFEHVFCFLDNADYVFFVNKLEFFVKEISPKKVPLLPLNEKAKK